MLGPLKRRSFGALIGSQFLGAFNDNAFKQLVAEHFKSVDGAVRAAVLRLAEARPSDALASSAALVWTPRERAVRSPVPFVAYARPRDAPAVQPARGRALRGRRRTSRRGDVAWRPCDDAPREES